MHLRRTALLVIGSLALLLGALGVLLPILPTTPFVLLASLCFAQTSDGLHQRLVRSRFFGTYIEHYRYHTGVPLRTKLQAIAFVWLGLGLSMVLVGKSWLTLLLSVVGLGVTLHLALMRPRP